MIAITKVWVRRGLRHDAEPAERIALLVGPQYRGRDRWSAHAVIAVAAGDVIAVDPSARSFFLIGHIGSARREFMQSHVISLIDDLSAGCIARRTKVFGDCGLAIGHHGLAGEFLGVDEEPWPSLPGNRRTVMGMPLAI